MRILTCWQVLGLLLLYVVDMLWNWDLMYCREVVRWLYVCEVAYLRRISLAAHGTAWPAKAV